jgi:AraC-like DNA-binding protein
MQKHILIYISQIRTEFIEKQFSVYHILRIVAVHESERNEQSRVGKEHFEIIVCYTVGFNDMPHFVRVFTREMGMSPAKFRKQFKGGNN